MISLIIPVVKCSTLNNNTRNKSNNNKPNKEKRNRTFESYLIDTINELDK